MPIELLWSNQARADLLEIYAMIGLEQPAAAERYFDRIEAKTKLLTSQPRIGIRRTDIRPSMRMLVEAPYLLLTALTRTPTKARSVLSKLSGWSMAGAISEACSS